MWIGLRFRRCGEAGACRRGAWALTLAFAAGATLAAQSAAVSLLSDARTAEAQYQFDAATDRLYRLVIEHPRSLGIQTARLQLARLLALSGDYDAAMLQCQAVRDQAKPGVLERDASLHLATVLGRRLRGSSRGAYFSNVSMLQARGLPTLEEPVAIEATAGSEFFILDRSRDRVYRLDQEVVELVPNLNEPSAIAGAAAGDLLVADKQDLVRGNARTRLVSSPDTGGRELDEILSLGVTGAGDLVLIDDDVDGVLKCAAGESVCVPFGTREKARVVKVGQSGFVFVLDDDQKTVRIFESTGRPVATVSGQFGRIELKKIVDLAVDQGYGFYLLDADQRRVHLGVLQVGAQGRLDAVSLGAADVPPEEQAGLKEPSAIGVMPDGTVLVAGRRTSRVLRYD